MGTYVHVSGVQTGEHPCKSRLWGRASGREEEEYQDGMPACGWKKLTNVPPSGPPSRKNQIVHTGTLPKMTSVTTHIDSLTNHTPGVRGHES
jgi:hypothetical protein